MCRSLICYVHVYLFDSFAIHVDMSTYNEDEGTDIFSSFSPKPTPTRITQLGDAIDQAA